MVWLIAVNTRKTSAVPPLKYDIFVFLSKWFDENLNTDYEFLIPRKIKTVESG